MRGVGVCRGEVAADRRGIMAGGAAVHKAGEATLCDGGKGGDGDCGRER